MILDLNMKNLKLCFYPYCDSFELPFYQEVVNAILPFVIEFI